ncbi:hypothetical protein [Desulfofundulus sp.]|uniref:hypothetical protein n=1 Tax=Desulfofundulus sp. TaxID=2282750 RepID=UPI003C759D5D
MAAILTGVCFAVWGGNLTINEMVNTGNADVAFTRQVIRADRFINCSISQADPATVRVNADNLYPGGKVWIDVQMTNQGTIPVRFDSASLNFDEPSSPLIPYLLSWCWLRYDEDGPGPEPARSYGFVQFPWQPFASLPACLNNSSVLRSIVLKPGGWISLEADGSAADSEGNSVVAGSDDVKCICIKLADNAPREIQNRSLGFTLQMNFKQWNL